MVSLQWLVPRQPWVATGLQLPVLGASCTAASAGAELWGFAIKVLLVSSTAGERGLLSFAPGTCVVVGAAV